jgi:serine/threonine protein kinase
MLQRIGRYEVLETMAGGGQGTVYRARDTTLDRVVVVKVIGQSVAHSNIVATRTFSHC